MPDEPPDFEDELEDSFPQFHEALGSAFHRLPRLDRMLKFKLNIDRAEHVDEGPLDDVIYEVLRHCKAEGKLTRLLIGAHEFVPENPGLKRLYIQYFPPTVPPAIAASGMKDKPDSITRLPHLYRLDWLTEVQRSAMAVARISNGGSLATGFLAGKDLLLTCNYVFTSKVGDGVEVYFPELTGRPGHFPRVVRLAANWLVAFSPLQDLDYSLVRLAAPVGEEEIDGSPRGWLALSAGPIPVPANLVQLHFPSGGPLSASFVSTLSGGLNSRVAYEYATRPGSGGAPSLDHTREVVALHEKHSPSGQQGEGVRADAIVQDLERQGIKLPKFGE